METTPNPGEAPVPNPGDELLHRFTAYVESLGAALPNIEEVRERFTTVYGEARDQQAQDFGDLTNRPVQNFLGIVAASALGFLKAVEETEASFEGAYDFVEHKVREGRLAQFLDEYAQRRIEVSVLDESQPISQLQLSKKGKLLLKPVKSTEITGRLIPSVISAGTLAVASLSDERATYLVQPVDLETFEPRVRMKL